MTLPADGTLAAAIDIGSNSIKMTVGRSVDGTVEQVGWASEVVRLGEGLDRTGRLADDRVEMAIVTLLRFAEQARESGAETIVAVATEATRAAANGQEFLERVRDETGIAVRVIDGNQEAALTFAGVAATLDMTGWVLIADIGGGSTELVVARDGALLAAKSIPLGSGRLTDKFVISDPPLRSELDASERDAGEAIEETVSGFDLQDDDSLRLVIVGGTGEFMARLVPDEATIDLGAVRAVLGRLEAIDAAALATELGIPEARARVLPAGVAIVAAIASRLRPEQIGISRSGIRAGLLRELFAGRDETNLDTTTESDDAQPTAHTRDAREERSDEAPEEPEFRETMTRLIGERWRAVWKAIPVALEGEDIEGVHDVRVASRRLRAAMDIAAPVFPRGWYRPLHRAAKEITSALGEVRDRDVLLVALAADRDAAPLAERPGIDHLIERIKRERVQARREMEAFLRELLDGPVPAEVERRFGTRQRRKQKSASDEEQ